MPTWVKVCPPGVEGWGWYQSWGGILVDPEGRQLLHSEVTVLDIQVVEKPEDLDWKGSYVAYNEILTYGWLSLAGEHFVCARRTHSLYARFILGTPHEMLETRGWIRTTEAGDTSPWVRSPLCCVHMTQAQRDWLFDHGLL